MTLPTEVLEMLRRNRLVHLATCKDNVPSASLMNFTLIEPEDAFPGASTTKPMIVMATFPDTQKYENIEANPNVSLLLHDWVTASNSETGGLASYLQRLNQSQLAQKSATLMGFARIPNGDEAIFYREKHLNLHKDAECYIRNAKIILVDLKSVRVADSKNHVEQY